MVGTIGAMLNKIQASASKSLYTTDEAMLVLGMSKPTILKKMREKKLKFDGNGGRGGYRFKKEYLFEYARNNDIDLNWDKVKDKQSSFDILNDIFNEQDIKRLENEKNIIKLKVERCKLELQLLKICKSDEVEVIKENESKKLEIKLKLADIMEIIIKYQMIFTEIGFNSDKDYTERKEVEGVEKLNEHLKLMTPYWVEIAKISREFSDILEDAEEYMYFDTNQDENWDTEYEESEGAEKSTNEDSNEDFI